MKDLATRKTIMRCNSHGDLCPFFSNTSVQALLTVVGGDVWHQRLGHPSNKTVSMLSSHFLPNCNKGVSNTSVCPACQLGKQPRLPFPPSHSFTSAPFQLIHCDLWTSPISSFSGFQYYLVILDDYSHYSWTFPLRHKSDTVDVLHCFHAYVLTQFHASIQCMQCDNGGEFLTTSLRDLFSRYGASFRLSCPHTSHKTARPGASSAPPTTFCTSSSSTPIYPPHSGSRPSTLPPTS